MKSRGKGATKPRVLTEFLKKVGEQETLDNKGHRKPKHQVLAEAVWELLIEGKYTFPSQHDIKVSARDWKDAVQWLYHHIDGPPVREQDGSISDAMAGATEAELERLVAAAAGIGSGSYRDVTASSGDSADPGEVSDAAEDS